MQKVAICKNNNPKKIIDFENVHYFYWPVELGFGWIEIGKLKIPSFPLKFLDYEPVKRIEQNDEPAIITRFHYRIFVYFTNLKLNMNNEPLVDFSFGSHSPLAHIEFNNSGIGNYTVFQNADPREIDAFRMLFGFYEQILKRKLKLKECESKCYDVKSEKIPEDFKFEPSTMNALIFVGKYPTPNELRMAGFNLP